MTRPKARLTMLIMAKCTGCSPACSASGWRIEPTTMMAGIASRKQPTTRNTAAMKKPVRIGPICHAITGASSASGIL